jgi:hypothetical protein
MWTRLDDALLGHPKLIEAGELLGKDGRAIALGVFVASLLWSNRHLTDGKIPLSFLSETGPMRAPVSVADALVKAGLWEKNGAGFVIHDYGDYNESAAEVKARRRRDRQRKRADS